MSSRHTGARARRSLLIVLVLSLATATSTLLWSCAKSAEPSGAIDDAGQPVDPVLLAFLSRARSAHHMADQLEQDEQPERAIGPLQALVDGPAPGRGGSDAPPEVREVMADSRARLADLKSQLGRFDDAASDVERGLAVAQEVTYFRGHLFEVRGLVEERRAKSLTDKGDSAGAEQAKKRALDAFEQSMGIQAEVIKKATGQERSDEEGRRDGAPIYRGREAPEERSDEEGRRDGAPIYDKDAR